ncbi:MAG: hypothetical protein QOF37_338, partial [Thermoleophilaceae bacterium]|nr:hypothetical protein [Thermoleophilaceae bacterium]
EVTGVMIALTTTERRWTRAEESLARILGHQLGAVVDGLASPGKPPDIQAQSPSFGALLEQQ